MTPVVVALCGHSCSGCDEQTDRHTNGWTWPLRKAPTLVVGINKCLICSGGLKRLLGVFPGRTATGYVCFTDAWMNGYVDG